MSKTLQIGLLGAPHSGKEAVIREFRQRASELPSGLENVVEIRNPGRTLQERFDVAAGSFGSYREDLWALFEIMRREREYAMEGLSYITSSTGLGCLAHAVANLETVTNGMETPTTQAETMARQYTLAVMTMLVIEHTRYNFVFRLPWPTEQPEGMDDFEWYYGSKVEKVISPTLEQMNLLHRIQVLKPGSAEEQALEMIETINAFQDRIVDDGVPTGSEREPGGSTTNA